MEVVASLSQGRTAAAQCGLFTYKSAPVIFEPPRKYVGPTSGFRMVSTFVIVDLQRISQNQCAYKLVRTVTHVRGIPL